MLCVKRRSASTGVRAPIAVGSIFVGERGYRIVVDPDVLAGGAAAPRADFVNHHGAVRFDRLVQRVADPQARR